MVQKPAAKDKGSSWSNGEIPVRRGNTNVLVISPHGHHSNDERTYDIGRKLADTLDSYAIVNKIYRKLPFKKDEKGEYIRDENGKKVRHDPDKSKKVKINLNRVQRQVALILF